MSFRFKRFSVQDDKSTMKVGTDAVLLGAWANTDNTDHILEIGTGSGVIALMLAQRSNALVTAIDIDKDSCEQALDNFEKCQWPTRLELVNTSLQTWQTDTKFNLIVSNPPYFMNQLKSLKPSRNISGHDVYLNYDELITHSVRLLKKDGRIAFILPFSEASLFREKALRQFMYPIRICHVHSMPSKVPLRVLMEFSNARQAMVPEEHLIIRNEDGTYHNDLLNLTSEFYLFA